MRTSRILPTRLAWTLLALLLLGGALPRARAAQEDPEKTFLHAYYLQHEEQRPEEALVLYLRFLAAAPEHPWARKAAAFAYGVLQGGSQERVDAFLRAYGTLLEGESPPPRAADAAPDGNDGSAAAPSADVLLLERYLVAAAQPRRPAEIAQAELQLRALEDLRQAGEFVEAARRATRAQRTLAIWRVAEMLRRKLDDVEALEKRRAIHAGFGEDAESQALQEEISRTQQALDEARGEAGLHAQIARLYAPVFSQWGTYGFLGLVVGISTPRDPAFAAWLRGIQRWLKDQALRTPSRETAVQEALAIAARLQEIDALLLAGQDEQAASAARRLWTELVG